MIQFVQDTQTRQIHRNIKLNRGYHGLGGRMNEELLFNRHRVPVLQDEKSSVDGWWGWVHKNMKLSLNCSLKNGEHGKF